MNADLDRWHRIVRILILAIVPLFIPGLIVCAEPWNQWRGPDQSGRTPTQAPLEWSHDRNVAWVAPVPGRGNSSPVVWENHIYLTTAYETDRWFTTRRAIAEIEAGLMVLVAAGAMLHLGRTARRNPIDLRTTSKYAASVVLILGAAFLSAAVLVGESLMDYARSPIRAWLGAGVAVSCGFVVAARFVRPRSRIAVVLAIVAIGFGLLLVIAIPDKPKAFRYGLVGPNAYVVLACGLLPVLTGLYVLRRRPLFPNLAPLQVISLPSRRAVTLRVAALLLCTLALVATCIVAVQVARDLSDYIDYHVSNVRFVPIIGPSGLTLTALAFALAVAVIVFAPKSWRVLLAPFVTPLVVAASVVLAPLHFVRANHLPTKQETVRAVVCLDANAGKALWTYEAFPGPAGEFHRDNSPATPTPCANEHGVFAWFGAAGLLALSHSGKLLWTDRDLPYDSPYGAASSPVLHGHTLVLSAERPREPYLVAWDTRTGKRRWTAPLTNHPEYAGGSGRTPLVLPVRGKPVVLDWTFGSLDGYDLHAGGRLFTYPLRTNGEVAPSLTHADGALYAADLRFVHRIDPDQLGIEPALPVEWIAKVYGTDVASPLVSDGLVFVPSLRGFVTCLDAETGDTLWKKRVGGRFYASPIAAGGRAYFTDYDGQTAVLSVSPTFELLSENRLDSLAFASPVPLPDGRLLIRTAHELYCIESPAHANAVLANAGAPMR